MSIWVRRYESRDVESVAEKINLVSNLSYSQQPLIEAPVRDGVKIASNLSKNLILRKGIGLGPNLVDHSDDITRGVVVVCTKKLADGKVRIFAVLINSNSWRRSIVNSSSLPQK
jgi:hypothetical protein